MADAKDVKATLQRELELLAKVRDDVRLQIKLAKTEVLDEWKKLESTWLGVEAELKRIGEQTKEPVKDMAAAARALMDELRNGYGRIRAQLKEARQSAPAAAPSPSSSDNDAAQRKETRLSPVQSSRGPSA
jgi:predicted  nucleic acid-binding Zn-ribbon protein